MQPFTTFTAVAVPFDHPNVDTDQIAPARFLRRSRDEGYQSILFHDLRTTAEGWPAKDFVLNKPVYRNAGILVAGRNFGGGSSREQAVWALVDSGFRCVIAESFGDIFFQNSVNHGLLLIRLPEETVATLRRALHKHPGAEMTVDLVNQRIIGPGSEMLAFTVEPWRRPRLLRGIDAIGLTLEREREIAAFEQGYLTRRHWVAKT